MAWNLFVGTADGIHVLGNHPSVELPGHDIRAIAFSEDGRCALAERGTVWCSQGGEWREIGRIDPPEGNCIEATSSGVWVGAAGGALYRLVDGAATRVESFDDAPDRGEWYTPWGGPPDVRSSAAMNGSLFVNVHVGGILHSDDDGASWRPTIDLHLDVHEVAVDHRDGTLYAACAHGLAESRDGGGTWDVANDGMHAAYCRAVAIGEKDVYVSASHGPHGGHGAVYRRPLGSTGEFERCADGLPEWFEGNVDTFHLAAGGEKVAIAVRPGTIYRSSDAGRTWELVTDNLPNIRCIEYG